MSSPPEIGEFSGAYESPEFLPGRSLCLVVIVGQPECPSPSVSAHAAGPLRHR